MSENENEKQTRTRKAENSTLPLVEQAIPKGKERVIVAELLKEAKSLKTRVDKDEDRLKEIKMALTEVAELHDLRGFRLGKVAFEYSGYQTRRSLDKGLLVENGCPPEAIDLSYKETEPFLSAKIVVFDS